MDFLNLLGFFAAMLTSLAFVPQAIRVIQTRQTKDISRNSYILLNLGISLWLLYGIMKMDLPIIIANSTTIIFSMTILIFKLKEKD